MFAPLTAADLRTLWRRVFPRSYTRGIETEAGGQGFDAFSQQAEQLAAVEDRAALLTQAYYLRAHSTQVYPPAEGAARATGTLQVTRAAPATGAITLVQGTAFVVRQRGPDGVTRDGERFVSTSDVTIAGGTLGPVAVSVQAERVGYQGNVPKGSISAFAERGTATVTGTVEADNVLRDNGLPDRLSPGMVGLYVRFIGGANVGAVPRRILGVTQGTPTSTAVLDGAALVVGPAVVDVEEFATLGLTVEQPAETTGGRHGFLDAIGRDRNTPRAPAESDDAYRARLGILADIISPAAIERIAATILTPLGIRWRLMETRDPGGLIGFVWDLHPYDAFGISEGIVYLDEVCGAVRFFVLLVSIGAQGEFGMAYDAVPFTPANAWDFGAYDGYPREYLAAIGGLFDLVDRARAAGVCWELIRDPSL